MSDPTTGLPFTYSVNGSRSKAQLLGFLEDQANVSYGAVAETAYATSAPLYPFARGDSLGIILSNTGGNSNAPLQSVNTGSFDLKSTDTLAGYTAYQASKTTLSNQELLTLASTYAAIPRTMQVKLTASDKAASDAFGAVAIS